MSAKSYSKTINDTLMLFIEKETISIKDSIEKVEKIISLSREYRNLEPELSYKLGKKALLISKKIDYLPGIASAYNRIGSYYRQKGSNLSAVQNYYLALDLFQSLNDTLGMIICYNGLGNSFMHQRLYDEALLNHEKAIELATCIGDTVGLAINFKNIAFIFLEVEQYDKSQYFANKALNIGIGKVISNLLPNFYQVLAQSYYYNNNVEKAIELHNKAIDLCKKTKNDYYLSYSYKLLGEIYIDQGDYNIAKNYLMKSLEIEKSLNLILSQQDIFYGLYYISKQKGEYAKALEFFKEYVNSKDISFNTQIQNEITDLITYYSIKQELIEVEIFEAENNILLLESRRKIMLFNFVLISLGLFFVLVVVIWIVFKRQAKISALLVEKNEEIKNQSKELLQKNAELEAQKEEIFAQNNVLEESNKYLQNYIKELEILNLAVQETDNSVIITDSECDYVWVNSGFERMFGYNIETLKEKGGNLIESSNLKNIEEIVNHCIYSKKPANYESTDENVMGETLYLRTTITPFFDKFEKLKNLLIVESDITILKKTELELEKLNNVLVKKVSDQIEKSREKDMLLLQQSRPAAMGEMINYIGHQWRQPLSAIAVIIQNMQEAYFANELTEEYVGEKVGKILTVINQMAKNLDEFRCFFMPADNKNLFDLYEIASRVISFMNSALKELHVTINLNVDKGVLVYGFENEFTQILINLIKNSKEAFETRNIKNPLIDIFVAQKNEEKVVIGLSDNAGGIDSSILSQVFDPVFSSKDEVEYIGLGLFMAKTLLEKNMNGSIWFENIENGVAFFIECPVKNEAESANP